MDLVDLDDPPTKRCLHFPAFLSLKRCKHISGSACLKLTVLARLQKCAAEAKKYKVYLLTNLAVLGHTFNPISVYYVFEQSRLVNIVAEVTNIPWHEKTTYILHIDDGNRISNRIHEKKLHVSPFNPHNKQLYKFDFSIRTSAAQAGAASMQALFFSIQVYDRDTHASNLVMTVSYSLSASPFRLLRGVRPLFTIVRIHYQAAKLWAKRFVVYEHPLRRSKTSDDARNYIRNTE